MTTHTTTRTLISLMAVGMALGTPTHAEDNAASQSDEVKLIARQVIAYNARDLDGFLATYSDDAVLYDLAGDKILASGEADLRVRYTDRFTNSPDLHATIRKRLTVGPYVIDRESVIKKKGEPKSEAIAIYLVRGKKIRRVWFLFFDAKSATPMPGILETVNKLFKAINDHDAGRAIRFYAQNAQAKSLPDNQLVIRNRAEQSDRLAKSFESDPAVRVGIIDTIAAGDFIVVHERITGSAGNPFEDVVVYHIVDGEIRRTWVLLE